MDSENCLKNLDKYSTKIYFNSIKHGRTELTVINNFMEVLKKNDIIDEKPIIKELKKKLGTSFTVIKKISGTAEEQLYCISYKNREKLQECIIKVLGISVKDFDKDYSDIKNQ